jgi:hypothetical protein
MAKCIVGTHSQIIISACIDYIDILMQQVICRKPDLCILFFEEPVTGVCVPDGIVGGGCPGGIIIIKGNVTGEGKFFGYISANACPGCN